MQYCSVVHPEKTRGILHARRRRACNKSRVFEGCTTEQYSHAVCNFTARTWIMHPSLHGFFLHKFLRDFLFNIVFNVILNKIKLKVIIMNECGL